MNLRLFLLVAASAGLLACTSSAVQETRSPKAQKELTEALAGRTADPAVSCIPNYRDTHMEVIDDWTILFRDGRIVYVQNPRGGCHGLRNGAYTLVTRQIGTSQLCDGEINQLIDLRTGFNGGSCVFGPFLPYRKAN